MTKSTYAYLALIAASLLWGGAYVANVFTLSSFPTFTLLAIRFMTSSVLIFAFFFRRIKKVSRKEFLLGVPLGALMFFAYYLQTYALNYTSVANSSFLTSLFVVFTPYIVWAAYKKRPSLTMQLASVLAFIGVAVMSLDGVEIAFNFGDFLTILCAILFSVSIIWAEKVAHIDFRLLTFIQLFVGGVFSTIAAVLLDPPIKNIEPQAFYAMLYLIILATTLCYLLQMFAMRHVPSTLASIILSFEVVFATLASYFILGEALTLNTFISILCMLGAVLLSTLKTETFISFFKK